MRLRAILLRMGPVDALYENGLLRPEWAAALDREDRG